jgi:uncharacterized membrane protein
MISYFYKNISIYNLILGLSIVLYIVLFTYLSFSQHDGLKTQMNDLGNMSQPIYNTTQGKFMFSSNYIIAEKYELVRFGIHANFILLLFVPIYYFLADPKVLLFTQTLLIGLGAYPLYLLSKCVFKKSNYTLLVFPLAYLINPMVHDVNLYDFHPVAVAMPLIIFAFYFLYTKKYMLFYLFAFFLSITNEDMPLIVAMMGIYMFFAQKERFRGLVVFLIAAIYFFVTVQFIMPYFMEGTRLEIVHRRYSHLGDGAFGIVGNFFVNPGVFFKSAFTIDKLSYVATLLLPVLYLPFLSLNIFFLALPSLIINLLSSEAMTYYPFHFYHTAPILSFVFISAVFSFYKLKNYKRRNIYEFSVASLLISSLFFSLFFSPAPYSLVSSWSEFKVSEHAKKITDIKKIIPNTASLSVQNNIGAHFSHREQIYTFPFLSDQTEYVLLDVTDPYEVVRVFPRDRNFMFISRKSLDGYFNETMKMFENPNYSVLYASDGYLLFKKGKSSEDLSEKAMQMFESKYEDLKSKYII